MDDRTLLERAANAAGYTLKWGEVHMIGDDEIDCTDQPYVVSGQPDEADWYWDPLNDDGDALRLAVKLKFIVGTYDTYASVCHTMILGGQGDVPDDEVVWVHSTNGDPYAATRRAIVRAAAAMGGE